MEDMENYENKYKALVEAVKTLKEANPSDEGIQNWVNDNVPELKELEDERAWLTKYLQEEIDCLRFDIMDYKDSAKVDNLQRVLAWLEKQCQQKPIEWSVEDSNGLQNTIALIEGVKNINSKDEYCMESCEYCLNWLKSLRPQNRWRPSDEQIKAIRLARSFITDDFDDNPTLSEILIGLEKDLKKLKGE